MQDVTVTLYERETGRYGELEYFYRIAIVPGGRVVNVFYPSGDIPKEEALQAARKEIESYLKENGFNATTKY